VLAGQGAIIVGDATQKRVHLTDGNLFGQPSVVDGLATRFRTFASTGILAGQIAVINGSASKSITHITSGALAGQSSIVDGAANHASLYPEPSTVAAGVQYGPGGIYIGTLTVGGGETIIALRSFTGRF
jgi:hypothetical protein